MYTTLPSLLERIRERANQDAWVRFVNIYNPLLFFWARRLGLQDTDVGDLVQDVFALLLQKLPEFRYDQQKSFRNWLRTLLLNKWRDGIRRRKLLDRSGYPELVEELPAPEEFEAFGESEYRRHLVSRALHVMQTEFPPKTWKACWEHVVEGRSAEEVARELGIAVGSVYVAKSRVVCRLREELQGLWD